MIWFLLLLCYVVAVLGFISMFHTMSETKRIVPLIVTLKKGSFGRSVRVSVTAVKGIIGKY